MMNIKANKELRILLDVCDYSGFEVVFENNKIVCRYANSDSCKQTFKYDNISDALIDWLPTMEEQQEGIDVGVDMWSKEIKYVKELKANREIQKFLYDNLIINFAGNEYDLGFGTSCDFYIHSPIKPMFKVGTKTHHLDVGNECTDVYVEMYDGRVEKNEETGEILIWIFEPSINGGGKFLHLIKDMLHYHPMELQDEIIKRWNKEVNGK